MFYTFIHFPSSRHGFLYERAGEIGVNTFPFVVHLQIKIDKDSWILQNFNDIKGEKAAPFIVLPLP